MSKNANYEYIKWLPENRMVIATEQAMLQDEFISSLFGKNIFGYARDDNASLMLPAITINPGKLFSYDNYDRLEGEIVINLFVGLDVIRAGTTEVINTSLAVIRSRIQNNDFIYLVSLAMFDYNATLSRLPDYGKIEFKEAMATSHPLQRYGNSLEVTPADSYELNGASCYKATMKFKYWIGQLEYLKFLEIMGINSQYDPNKIVYTPFETFNIDI